MTQPTTWLECAEAGMSLTASARLLGKTVAAGWAYAKRHGFTFPKDPEFAERSRERMKALHADPEFAERHRERNRERMKALNADPEFNPLVDLTPDVRADYDVLRKKGGMTREAALRAVGRADLIKGVG